MNKLATALLISALAMVLIGCSSGSTSTPVPQNVSGTFAGSFSNTSGTQDGTAIFNLSQPNNSNEVSGNAIFDTATRNTCLIGANVTNGSVQGFGVSLSVGSTSFQLTIGDNGNTLTGTYVQTSDSEGCSGQTGSGSITLRRS